MRLREREREREREIEREIERERERVCEKERDAHSPAIERHNQCDKDAYYRAICL